jgi:hypothetical protein
MSQANRTGAQDALRMALSIMGSTWLGVGLIALIAVYLALASTMPLRLAGLLGIELFSLEGSVHSELYEYPPFVGLCLALCANLLVATLLRIRPRWHNLGALCCHGGVILLALGGLWYAARSFAGDNVTVRLDEGWTPIRYVYRKESFAAYVSDPDSRQPVPTPLRGVNPRKARVLDVLLAGVGEGVEVRATRFVPRARVVEEWRDDSPAAVAAVRIRVTDGDQTATVVLCPAAQGPQPIAGPGFLLAYRPGLDAPRLKSFLEPADANQAPAMPRPLVLILTGPRIPATLAVMRPDRSRWHGRLEPGKALDVPVAGRTVRFEALDFFTHARRAYELAAGDSPPRPGEPEAMPPAGPVLRAEIRVGDWRRTTHVPFFAYAPEAPYEQFAPPQIIDLPGGRAVKLRFSRDRVPLPATLHVRSAQYQTYPASGIPKDYRCDVEVVSGGVRRRETLSLNHPVHVGPYQFSQGTWAEDPHQPTRIFLTAASRPALPIIWAGCLLICLGLPVAFYLKPLLLGRAAR